MKSVIRGAALCAVAALIALVAGAPPADSAKKRRAAARSLLVVGDSLAVGTRPYVRRHLRGWRVRQRTSISMHAPQGPRVMRRFRRRLPRVVFVSLGTNDGPRDVAGFRRSLRRVMRIAGPRRCVVWSTIKRPPVGGASYRRLNRALVRQARRRERLIAFRWARLARLRRLQFARDGVHPTATGYRIRARAMARDIRACRRIALRRRR